MGNFHTKKPAFRLQFHLHCAYAYVYVCICMFFHNVVLRLLEFHFKMPRLESQIHQYASLFLQRKLTSTVFCVSMTTRIISDESIELRVRTYVYTIQRGQWLTDALYLPIFSSINFLIKTNKNKELQETRISELQRIVSHHLWKLAEPSVGKNLPYINGREKQQPQHANICCELDPILFELVFYQIDQDQTSLKEQAPNLGWFANPREQQPSEYANVGQTAATLYPI